MDEQQWRAWMTQSIERQHQNLQVLYETVSRNYEESRAEMQSLRADVQDLVKVGRSLINTANDHDGRLKGLEGEA